MLPAEWGSTDDRRLAIREPGLLAALTCSTRSVERAIARRRPGSRRPGEHRDRDGAHHAAAPARRGAKDEQIARSLGVSLRTVRRRMADLFEELGVESRFQAGVEAVRDAGWL